MIRFYSGKYCKFINFDATGKMDGEHPILKGFDCMGTEYTAIGIENTGRTLVTAKDIKVKDGDK